MNFIQKNFKGILVCFLIAIPSWLIGKAFPVIGGPVIAILAGMVITCFWTEKGTAESGIKWTSKIILQTAVVLLGFGMNLGVILQTGKQSLRPEKRSRSHAAPLHKRLQPAGWRRYPDQV